jgi:outer membrane protein assembly factor BamD
MKDKRMKSALKLLCVLAVTGCAFEKESSSSAERSVEDIYTKACSLLKENEYKDAAAEFKNIESQFPYSIKASEGQILAAYCYFLASEYPDALREIEVFLRYHPSHALVPYALYLKAMCKYVRVASAGRDSEMAMNAGRAFTELMNKFPRSEYGRDAKEKIRLLDELIAAHEMLIGRYYQKEGNASAAINRYAFTVRNFCGTNYAKEALYRTVECYLGLGLREEAQNALRTLETEFSMSHWTTKASLLMQKII